MKGVANFLGILLSVFLAVVIYISVTQDDKKEEIGVIKRPARLELVQKPSWPPALGIPADDIQLIEVQEKLINTTWSTDGMEGCEGLWGVACRGSQWLCGVASVGGPG